MSITATLSSREKGEYDIPVCTQNIFTRVISPVADRLGLDLVSQWGTFVEVTSVNLDDFLTQIDTLVSEIAKSDELGEAVRVHVRLRLSNLKIQVLEVAGSDPDFEVLVG